MRIEPADTTLGAYVTDVTLAELDADTFAELEAAWHRHAVLIFPGQHLSDADHLAFSRRFGVLERGIKRTSTSGLGRLSNVDDNGHVVAPDHLKRRFQLGNQLWHSDSSYKRIGAKASLLAAHVVPTEGGQTELADQRAAYDALSAQQQRELEDKWVVHSYRYSHTWHGGLEHLDPSELDDLPAVEHRLVGHHPDTGRRHLFVGRHASHIVGEDLTGSRARLRELTEWVATAPRVLTHRWSPGDLVLWDNRCVLHRGRTWPDEEARVMVRTTVAGDAPAGSNEWALSA